MYCSCSENEIKELEISEKRTYELKGQSIEIDVHLFKCPNCGDEWSVDGFDVSDEINRVYRSRHQMLQPEQIKRFRSGLALTQEEFAILLGFSASTVNRYEQGGLQELSHDLSIGMAMSPAGLKYLLNRRGNLLPAEKVQRLSADNMQPDHWTKELVNAKRSRISKRPSIKEGNLILKYIPASNINPSEVQLAELVKVQQAKRDKRRRALKAEA